MFSSPLQRALSRGLEPGGDLSSELSEIRNYQIRSRRDAKAICSALRDLLSFENAPEARHGVTRLWELASLFQEVAKEESPAFRILQNEGQSLLIRSFDEFDKRLDERDKDRLLFVLKILAMYGSREGAVHVVNAACKPLAPNAYLWSVVLSMFSGEHPHRDYVFDALSSPLPEGFIAVALLDSANRAAIEGSKIRHPFDSQRGKQRLHQWLANRDPDDFSYARSASTALPFVSTPRRDQLFALALDHVDPEVQMEAAWAAGRLGRESGLKVLARYCLDIRHSTVAQQYLRELNREDLIPKAVSEPSFQAKADFANWLSHPSELGRPPDEVRILDHRELFWPPDGETKTLWLMEYTVRDTSGLEDDDIDRGLVGGITWCFFSYDMCERPYGDIYAIHCYWELEHCGLISEIEVSDAAEYRHMLEQWRNGTLADAVVTQVAELSHQLDYPNRLVALTEATRSQKEGWVVLDGSHSAWYPREDFPSDESGDTVLMVHIGRRLLGFGKESSRRERLIRESPKREPKAIIEAYEKLLKEMRCATSTRAKELCGNFGSGALAKHFAAYVEALSKIECLPEASAVIRTYEQFLDLARSRDESIKSAVYEGVVRDQLECYVEALATVGRSSQVGPLIDQLAPFLDHNMGRLQLGEAAFGIGDFDRAEALFLEYKEDCDSYYRSNAMSKLAEILHQKGHTRRACELLIECLCKTADEFNSSKYDIDRQISADRYQEFRDTFVRLFPEQEGDLAARQLPAALNK